MSKTEKLSQAKQPIFRKPEPVQAAFELTPRCDFNCKMCYVHLTEGQLAKHHDAELTADEWIRLGRQAADAGTLQLTITGGEPLMHPEFPKIYRALSEMGFFITLQTNLSMMDGYFMDLIAERPPWAVKATLYGASEETYEKVCGIRGGFTRVKRGIENILEAKIPLMLVCTVIRENEAELENIYRLAASYGIEMKHTHNVMNSRRNENQQSIVHSRIMFEDLSQKERDELSFKPHQTIHTPLETCGNYMYGGYWILWNGHLSLCGHMDMDFKPLAYMGRGNPIKHCFSEMLESLAQKYPYGCCNGCVQNRFCGTCPAVLYAEQTPLGEGRCMTARQMMQCGERF